MPNPRKSKDRYYTGITLQPDVLQYVDTLAQQTDTNRSWIINAIVQEYVKLTQQVQPKHFAPLGSKEAVIHL